MSEVNEEYICEDCANTSLVPNQVCTVCGGKMTPLDAPVASKVKAESDDLELSTEDDLPTTDEGHQSLEALQEKEEEDEPPYGYGNDE